jgi:hypothetical protein
LKLQDLEVEIHNRPGQNTRDNWWKWGRKTKRRELLGRIYVDSFHDITVVILITC